MTRLFKVVKGKSHSGRFNGYVGIADKVTPGQVLLDLFGVEPNGNSRSGCYWFRKYNVEEIQLGKPYWYIAKKDYCITGKSGVTYRFKVGERYPVVIFPFVAMCQIGFKGTRVNEITTTILQNFDFTGEVWKKEEDPNWNQS
jgi:hypothetical protein